MKTKECWDNDPWATVVAARESGNHKLVAKLSKKLLRVSSCKKLMSESTKQTLKEYNKEHKDEIKDRRKNKNLMIRRSLDMLNKQSKPTKKSE
jgi:hypothetical protein